MQRSPPEVKPTRFWPGRRSLFLSPAGLRHQPTPTEVSTTRQALMCSEDTQSRSLRVSETQNIQSPQSPSKLNPKGYICVINKTWIQVGFFPLTFPFHSSPLEYFGNCKWRHIYIQTGSCPTWRTNSSTPSPKARKRSPSLSSPLWVQTLWVLPSSVTVPKHKHLVRRL